MAQWDCAMKPWQEGESETGRLGKDLAALRERAKPEPGKQPQLAGAGEGAAVPGAAGDRQGGCVTCSPVRQGVCAGTAPGGTQAHKSLQVTASLPPDHPPHCSSPPQSIVITGLAERGPMCPCHSIPSPMQLLHPCSDLTGCLLQSRCTRPCRAAGGCSHCLCLHSSCPSSRRLTPRSLGHRWPSAWPWLTPCTLPPESSICCSHKMLTMDLWEKTQSRIGQRLSWLTPSPGHSRC